MEKLLEAGIVTHTRTVKDGLQTDRIRVCVPLSALSEEARTTLDYWWVEDFNYAFIDWEEGLIKLYYRTDHYLPEGYEHEEVEEEVV